MSGTVNAKNPAFITLDRVVASLPTPTLLADAEGLCAFANQAWADLTGLDAADCRGRGWESSLDPRDRQEVVTAWTRLVERDEPLWVCCRVLSPRLGERWIRLTATRLPDQAGAQIWLQGQDVTDLQEARSGLSVQVRTLELVDNVTPVAQWRLDRRAFWGSERLHALLGTDRTTLELELWFQRHGASEATARSQFESAFRFGQPIDYNADIELGDRRSLRVRVLGRADFNLDGSVCALFGVAHAQPNVRPSQLGRIKLAASQANQSYAV